MGIDAPAYNHSSVGGIKFAHFNLHVSHAWCALVFLRSIESGSNYRIRFLWINAHTYILRGGGEVAESRQWIFMGKEGARFEVVRELPCITREEGGWADIKNGGQGREVMVKTIIIYARLSVWAQ